VKINCIDILRQTTDLKCLGWNHHSQ